MKSYDEWKVSGPHNDLPSHESQQCDRCTETWAWEAETGERLCEGHAAAFLRAEHICAEGDEIDDEERGERFAEWADAS